jgi:hypothetical protein
MDLRTADAWMQLKQILEQPDAGDAVNRRDPECHLADSVIAEIQQLTLNDRIIQAGPLLAGSRSPNPNAGVPVQVVEMFQTVVSKQIVNGSTALAAEVLFAVSEGMAGARFAAMVTACARNSFPARFGSDCR